MTGLKVRGLATAFAATAISVVAFAAPGTASAITCGSGGASIVANGSSFQAQAQQALWSATYNATCGPTEKVKYESTGSGPGLQSWGVKPETGKYKGFGDANAFVGTDAAPSEAEENEILSHASAIGAKVLSVPTLQAAVALPIHLPKSCTATEGKKKKAIGRLVLSDATLQEIFAHEPGGLKWSEVVTGENHLNCTEPAEAEQPIIRVVRIEGSGTTAVVKKFLFEIKGGKFADTALDENWAELAEGSNNVEWPEKGVNLKQTAKGSGIANLVAATPGSIGYGDLNEIRKNAAFKPEGGGGEGKEIFWPELESKGAKKHADPSTNKEENAVASSNCEGEAYISLNKEGKQGKFPPETTEDVWNEVTASIKQKKSYPLCGFTYDLLLTKYSLFTEPTNPTEPAEVETLTHYFDYVLGEGQNLLAGNDFLALPVGKKGGNVLATAQAGVAKAGF